MDTQDYRLILDIGTHKVLALAVKPAGDGVEVLASAFLRHSARSMRDGQVHDVEAVARTVRKAVDQVSEAVGVEFTGAHIAAAGRALQTARGGAERSEPHSVLITPEMTLALVWEAVADAQLQLLESLPPQEQQRGFYCIAHTVVESRLDGDVIGSLTGQRGRVFSVEVLATFLPGVVVDSLEAVLAQAGLAMHGLTLEPVAALEAVIPPTMRHLNLILVDIGAGTSDIALTGDGMVKAFAMVPRGGDAMTEAVSKKFLLDFHVAEQVKREAAAGRPAAVENVLGLPLTVAPEEAVAAMEDAMGLLVDDIARALEPWLRAAGREAAAPRALAAATPDTSAAAAPGASTAAASEAAASGASETAVPGASEAAAPGATAARPPEPAIDAVLLVGGGSHTPGLPQTLARRLGVCESRIAVRDRRAVRDVSGEEQLAGADVVTALGIALRAVRGKEMPPVRVRVNDRPVSLFQPDRCTVREAARIAGVPSGQLMGRPGPGITVTLNGDVTPLPGARGRPASVWVNGREASLDTVLRNQDEVTLRLPGPGAPPRVTLADLARRWLRRREADGLRHPRILLNGAEIELPVWLQRNGRRARPDDVAQDRDVIDIRFPATAAELVIALSEAGARPGQSVHTATGAASDAAGGAGHGWPYGICTVNGRPVDLSRFASLRRNGRPARWSDPVTDGDVWEILQDEPVTVRRVLQHLGIVAERRLHIILNGEKTSVPLPGDIRVNGASADAGALVKPGDSIIVMNSGPAALYQILPHAGVTPEDAGAGGRLVMQVQGRPAAFTTPVNDGDEVVIRYEQ